jgi:hypothetical protein
MMMEVGDDGAIVDDGISSAEVDGNVGGDGEWPVTTFETAVSKLSSEPSRSRFTPKPLPVPFNIASKLPFSMGKDERRERACRIICGISKADSAGSRGTRQMGCKQIVRGFVHTHEISRPSSSSSIL